MSRTQTIFAYFFMIVRLAMREIYEYSIKASFPGIMTMIEHEKDDEVSF
jgi:hypothetical protein